MKGTARLGLFGIALGAMAFGSCSSDDSLADGQNGPQWGADGTGYINFSINLPTQKGNAARAVNDQFGDGDASEYAVNDATLLLFKGASESAATFAAAYDMALNWNTDADNDQITSQGRKVVKINTISQGDNDKIYALVVLNKGNAFTVGDGNSIILGVDKTAFAGTFQDFSARSTDMTGTFYMSNTVLATADGKTQSDTKGSKVLVDVSNSIYNSESQASTNPAADIVVERGCAKIQVDASSMSGAAITIGSDKITPAYAGFALANTNAVSYLVRNWDNTWFGLKSDGDGLTGNAVAQLAANPYRFTGLSAITDGAATGNISQLTGGPYYRTYFGKDANYNSDGGFGAQVTSASTFNGNIKYCNENTFDVEHQNVKNTTSAIVKVNFTVGNAAQGTSFYIQEGDRSTIYLADAVKTKIANKALTVLKSAYSDLKGDITCSVELGDRDEATGAVKVSKATFTGTEGDVRTVEVSTQEALAPLQAAIDFTEYKGGAAYYTVLVKHFGDELTPWNEATKTTESYAIENGAASGVTADSRWLGRYGVLRNNWYVLSINAVKALGSAVPDKVYEDATWDDNVNKYISVSVNVLSWAKRSQGVVLQ